MDGDAYSLLATPFPQNQEKQAVEYCKEFRILDLSKGKTVCGPQEPFLTNISPVTCRALLSEPYHGFFWTSFLGVSAQHWCVVQAKHAQMGGYSCSPSDRLHKPLGTLPPAPSIHLVCWYKSTLLQPLLRVSQDLGQNVTIWTGLINGMKNGLPKCTSTRITFFLKWPIILIKKDIIIIFFFKSSETASCLKPLSSRVSESSYSVRAT